MSKNEKASKIEELYHLLGHYLELNLKDTKMMSIIPSTNIVEMKTSVEGYLIDVTDNFAYLGEDLESGFSKMVAIEDVGIWSIVEPEESFAELIKAMEEHDGGDLH